MWDFFSLSLSLSPLMKEQILVLCAERERDGLLSGTSSQTKASHGVICNTTAEEVFPCPDLRQGQKKKKKKRMGGINI